MALSATAVGLVQPPAQAASSYVTSPGQGRDHPILAANADCTDDGTTSNQVSFRVKNVDGVSHTGRIVYAGSTIDTFTVGAGADYTNRVDVAFDDDHLELFARYTDVSANGNESIAMLIRPNRCLDDNQPGDWQSDGSSPRTNGPVGFTGLECHDGVMKVAYDLENVDSVARRMSINVYSEGTQSVNDRKIVPNSSLINPGARFTGLADYPYNSTDTNGNNLAYVAPYNGDTLIRGWFRETGTDFGDPGAYHSRTWYESTPTCQAPPADQTIPSRPGQVQVNSQTGGSASISWAASSDNDGVTGYTVLRNLIPIINTTDNSASLTDLPAGDNFIQVVANDAAGNRSNRPSPTNIVVSFDSEDPSTPTNLQVAVNPNGTITPTWTASTDNVGVASYTIYRNNAIVAENVTTTTATLDLGSGDHYIQVRAFDAASNQSSKTSPVMVTVSADTENPSTPTNLQVAVNPNGTITPTWTASTDNVGVASYTIYRNNAIVAENVTTTTATLDLGSGDHYIQVRAFDAASNQSSKTSPVMVTVSADTENPSTPTNLQVAVNPNGTITPTWTASTDNVGVASYTIYRNNAIVAENVTTTTATLDLGSGDHYIQVRAFDAASNQSYKTSPVMVTVS